MNCTASVIVTVGGPEHGESPCPERAVDLARRGVARLSQLEQRWSRFLPTSEISGLNAAGGQARIASPDTVRLVEALVQAWHATSGGFDPTLLPTLVELGYAASRDDATLRTSLAPDTARQGQPEQILIDAGSGWIQLPHGTALDPGGLGKGLAADIVAEELLLAGAPGVLVEVGGDLRVVGTPPTGDTWTIEIAATRPGDRPRTVQLGGGGVATSTSRLRTWVRDGEHHHHLIDPRTLRSADTGVVSCTVIAGTAAWAEAFTKVAFAEDIPTAADRFDRRGLATSITTGDDRQLDSHAWKEFCR
jgi:thiamine biosynthesis lipoprotein